MFVLFDRQWLVILGILTLPLFLLFAMSYISNQALKSVECSEDSCVEILLASLIPSSLIVVITLILFAIVIRKIAKNKAIAINNATALKATVFLVLLPLMSLAPLGPLYALIGLATGIFILSLWLRKKITPAKPAT